MGITTGSRGEVRGRKVCDKRGEIIIIIAIIIITTTTEFSSCPYLRLPTG
jgi:hypothetical protein